MTDPLRSATGKRALAYFLQFPVRNELVALVREKRARLGALRDELGRERPPHFVRRDPIGELQARAERHRALALDLECIELTRGQRNFFFADDFENVLRRPLAAVLAFDVIA